MNNSPKAAAIKNYNLCSFDEVYIGIISIVENSEQYREASIYIYQYIYTHSMLMYNAILICWLYDKNDLRFQMHYLKLWITVEQLYSEISYFIIRCLWQFIHK
jgi:hypothetical protein